MHDAGFKLCPFCKEKIREEAVKCRFCGEWLEEASRPKSEPSQKHEDSIPTALIESEPTSTTQPADSSTMPTAQEPVTSKPDATQVEPTKEFGSNRPIKENPFIPLFLIVLWIFWFVLPQAIAHGASSITNLIYITLLYCISPITIIVLLLLGMWLWDVRRNFRSTRPSGQILIRTLPEKTKIIAIIALFLIAGFFTCQKIYLARERRTELDRQELQAKGINLDALKDWEITKADTKIGSGTTGLTPEIKKRMRESFALQCKGQLASIEGATVDLQGENHDKLTFAFNASLTKDSTKVFVDALRQNDPDWGNRLRFLNFSQLVLAGTNYSESFSQADFSNWSQNYDTFVSNTIAMYGTSGNQNSFFSNKNEIGHEMQETMRSRLADAMNGSLKSIYPSFEVKLAGTNDDVLYFSCKDASENDMNGILKTFQEDKNGYFFDGLKAMGFSELVLEGGTYRRSIPKSEFTQWCRNYDEYMAELQKVTGQISDAMKHEPTAPQSPP